MLVDSLADANSVDRETTSSWCSGRPKSATTGSLRYTSTTTTTRRGTCSKECSGSGSARGAGGRARFSGVGASGRPHTYRNAGDEEAEYLLVMPPRVAALIEAIHEPGADLPTLFRAHASELLA